MDMSLAKDFREFILRGNVIDLAVGVIIGGAFGKIVEALVKDIITPFIGMFGKVNLSGYNKTLHGATFGFGEFLNAVVSFFIIAFVVFFFIVKPVNHLMSLRKTDTAADPVTRECPLCLSSVPAAATRCAFCTSELTQD